VWHIEPVLTATHSQDNNQYWYLFHHIDGNFRESSKKDEKGNFPLVIAQN
jgi:hypothetical protein